MPAYVQSNTQEGIIVATPSADQNFVGKEGYFARLLNYGASAVSGNPALASLPTLASGLPCLYVVEDGGDTSGASASKVKLRPLSPHRNVRAVFSVSAMGGIFITASGDGRAMPYIGANATPSTTSGGWVLGVTEEECQIGEYGLFRPLIVKPGGAILY